MTFSYLRKFNEWGSLSVFMFSCRRLKSFIIDDINDDLNRYLLICTDKLMIHWTWRVQLHEKIKQIHNSWFWCVLSPSDSHQFTLDLNTVNKLLRLSENNRVITYTGTLQTYPDHPDRFDAYRQVLCRESVSGRCYWELEWSGDNGVFISVSYKSIIRKGWGKECRFGSNDQSWSLICSPSRYSFIHNNIQTDLSVKSTSRRIGVFVDHGAGTLSFYSVSDTMNLIHTVQTTFTQPLCPGFWVYNRSSAKLFWWIKTDWWEILPIMLWAAWRIGNSEMSFLFMTLILKLNFCQWNMSE